MSQDSPDTPTQPHQVSASVHIPAGDPMQPAIDRLLHDPGRFGFFQAVRLMYGDNGFDGRGTGTRPRPAALHHPGVALVPAIRIAFDRAQRRHDPCLRELPGTDRSIGRTAPHLHRAADRPPASQQGSQRAGLPGPVQPSPGRAVLAGVGQASPGDRPPVRLPQFGVPLPRAHRRTGHAGAAGATASSQAQRSATPQAPAQRGVDLLLRPDRPATTRGSLTGAGGVRGRRRAGSCQRMPGHLADHWP